MELNWVLNKLEEQNCVKDYAYISTKDNIENSSKVGEYYSYNLGIPTLFFTFENDKQIIIGRIKNKSKKLSDELDIKIFLQLYPTLVDEN